MADPMGVDWTPRSSAALLALHGRPLCMHKGALDALLTAQPHLRMDRGRERASFGYYNAEGVAVLPVMGTLMKRGTGLDWLDELLGVVSVERLVETFQMALRDPAVGSILLQIDSPGGEARGVFDAADAIFAARGTKPIVAIADEWAFSAGYLLAAAADRVMVPQTGGVGSIGVYTVRVDATAFDAATGIRWTIVEYGERKADGHPHKALSTDELDDLQASVNRIGDNFVAAVSRYRGLAVADLRAMQARTFDGEHGVRAGLADAVATFGDTILDMATAPQAGLVKRKEKQMDTPTKGGEVISLDEHRAALSAAEAKAVAARQESEARVEVFTEMCAAAGRLDLLAGFVRDPDATVLSVAKTLSAAKAEAQAAAEVQGQCITTERTEETFTFADFKAIHAARNAAIDAAHAARPTPVRVA